MGPSAKQHVVRAQGEAERPQGADAREHVAAVAATGARKPLLDQALLKRAAVRLVDDFARPALPDRHVLCLAYLVHVRVQDYLVLGHEPSEVGEEHFAALVRAGVHYGAPADISRARKRRAAVVERRGRTLAGDGVDLARYVHVKRLGERSRRLVGELGACQQRLVERKNLLRLLNDAKLAEPPERDRLHQSLKLGDKPLERNAAPHAKKLDLVVASVLRHAAERTRLPLVDRDELLHAAHELGGIVLRKRRETTELRESEEVDASR